MYNAEAVLKCALDEVIDIDIVQEIPLVVEEGQILDNDANNEHREEPQGSPIGSPERLVVLDANT